MILFNCGVYGCHKIAYWLLVNPNLTCLRPSKHGMFRSWWSLVFWCVFWHTYSSVFISAVLSLVRWQVHGLIAFSSAGIVWRHCCEQWIGRCGIDVWFILTYCHNICHWNLRTAIQIWPCDFKYEARVLAVYPHCMNILKKALWLITDGREESWAEAAQFHCHVQTSFKGSASEFLVEDTVWGIIWNSGCIEYFCCTECL